jgi:voltage-gated potassium channel Kch
MYPARDGWLMEQVEERNQTPVTMLRLAFIGLAIAALMLGYHGMDLYLAAHPTLPQSPIDILYFSLQLFVLDSDPLSEGGDLPWQLQVARFAAPAATVFALVETARVLLTSELHRLSARRARRHVVVCGNSAVARTLAARLHATGRRVIMVGTPPAAGLAVPRRRMYGVPGDPTSAETLRAAGVGQADVVYACTDDSTDNVLAAVTAGRLRDDGNATLRVYAQIHDPELCLSLQARRLNQTQRTTLRLDFFNAEELAARSLFVDDPLPPGRPARVLVIGASPFGRALLVEAARHWRVQSLTRVGQLRVELVAPDGRAAVNELFHRYPFLPDVCDVTVHAGDLDVVLAAETTAPPDRVYVTIADEEQRLKVALTTPSLWRGGPGSVVVPVSRLSGLALAFADGGSTGLLDAVSGTVRLYPVVKTASDPDRISDDLVERLARSIHDRYLLLHPAADEEGDAPARVPWAGLPEDLRRSNRAQAEDIGRKLRVTGLALAPRSGTNEPVEMTEEQVEYLAGLEHQRWRAEWEGAGWRPDRRRDGRSRTHPDLLDWADLPEPTREKNRREVREIPYVLADVGLAMVRAGGALARTPDDLWEAS